MALRTRVGGVERDGFFGDARRVAQQVELMDQLVSFQLILTTEGIRITPLLDLVVFETKGGEARACRCPGLIDATANR